MSLFSSARLTGDEMSLADRIALLREEIIYHDERYFREAAPEITDYEYDLLKLELLRLEAEAGVASSSDSIGDDLAVEGDEVIHAQPMLSLSKAYSEEEVTSFYEQVTHTAQGPVKFALEPKFDGVAVSVIMERGEFVAAATRGNGSRGEDISRQVNTIRGLRYEWEFDDSDPKIERIELRGEVYLMAREFDAINADRVAAGEAPFRHPRSVAAGAIKLTDQGEVMRRKLSLVFHGWGDVQPSSAEPTSILGFQRWLEARGIPSVMQTRFVTPATAAELNDAVSRLHESVSGVPIDGIVIKVDSVDLQNEMGNGAISPRWALARKFAPPRANTVLRRIVWQVGRSGDLTPVAEFDPVVLGGSTVRRASLSNRHEIIRRDLRLGDTIWIEKAGEIIPQIAGVLKDRRGADSVTYEMPTACPACERPLRPLVEGAQLHCEHYDCEDQMVQRLLHFVSKEALQIRGVGPVLARRLVAEGLVRSPDDLYSLTAVELTTLPGVGEKTAQRLLTDLSKSRGASLERWILGLGLPGVGKTGAHQLAREIGGLAELQDETHRRAALQALGPVLAVQVETHLNRPEVQTMITRLVEITP